MWILGTKCFDSLQPGRCITSSPERKETEILHGIVSIPFKREGVSQVKSAKLSVPQKTLIRFNSLQTGRCITSKEGVFERLYFKSFNSLQTGRCITSGGMVGRVYPKKSFNSLQPGRCITRKSRVLQERSCRYCFNSLQTGRCITSPLVENFTNAVIEFQFPSTGKVYHKFMNLPPAGQTYSFNSLQPGRCITSKGTFSIARDKKFQFPSNGKVYHKVRGGNEIPTPPFLFQFPSNGKVYHKCKHAHD